MSVHFRIRVFSEMQCAWPRWGCYRRTRCWSSCMWTGRSTPSPRATLNRLHAGIYISFNADIHYYLGEWKSMFTLVDANFWWTSSVFGFRLVFYGLRLRNNQILDCMTCSILNEMIVPKSFFWYKMQLKKFRSIQGEKFQTRSLSTSSQIAFCSSLCKV